MSSLRRIPLDTNLPWYRFSITLSGTRYVLEVRYNSRMDRWLLSIGDAAGNPIAVGLPLLVGRPIAHGVANAALPRGLFVVVDTTGNDTQPGLSGFVSDHALFYYDAQDA